MTTRKGKATQKRTVSLSVIDIDPSSFEGTNAVTMLNLPVQALVKSIDILIFDQFNTDVNILFDTDVTATIASTDTANAPNNTFTSQSVTIYSGTGMEVKIQPTAAVTAGKAQVCIHYFEPGLSNGQFTNY